MLRVLLAEDTPGDVRLVRQAMQNSSVTTQLVVACDGTEALAYLHAEPFDLVILDLNLPRCDGLAVIQRYGTPVGSPAFVVFSGSARQFDRELALFVGAKEYIIKPTDLGEYIQAVKDIVEAYGGQLASTLPGTRE